MTKSVGRQGGESTRSSECPFTGVPDESENAIVSEAPGPPIWAGPRLIAGVLGDFYTYLPHLTEKYGDVVRLPVPGMNVFMVSGSEHVNHLFNRHTDRYSHEFNVVNEVMIPGGPRALPLLDGAEWKKHRKVMQPPFLERNLESVSDLIAEALRDGIAAWEPHIERGDWFEFQSEIAIVVMSGLTRSMFNTDWDRTRLEQWVAKAGRHGDYIVRGGVTFAIMDALSLSARTFNRIRLPYLTKGRENYRSIISTIEDMIDERVAHPTERQDVLNILLASRFDDGTSMTKEELRSEMLALMFAGFETTAAVLSWAIAFLVRHPDELADAYAEVDALGKTDFGYDDLEKLPFLRACFDEAQRVQSHPFLGRIAKQDDVIGGYRIPKGSTVFTSIYGMHHDPRYWKQPELFRPRRFLEDEINKYAFLPFGVGPRRCLGVRMAYIEGVLGLANLLSNYRFELKPGWEPRRKFHLSTGLAEMPVRLHRR